MSASRSFASVRRVDLSDWLNVKSSAYNAKGDNSTDDTAAIAAALAALPAAGGVVYFPAGTYKITSALTIPDFATLIGTGTGSKIRQTTNTENGLNCTTAQYVTIRDLQVTGPGKGVGSGIGIYFNDNSGASSNRLVFENLLVQSWGSDGIKLETPVVSNLINVNVQSCGGHGFNINAGGAGTGGTSLSFNACFANSCSQAGYNLRLLHYSALNGCATDGCGIGYLLDTCQAITLNGCGSEATVNTDATYNGNAFRLTSGNTVELNGCYNYQNLNIAVKVTGGQNNTAIREFRENSPTGSATSSITVDSGCTGISLRNNKVTTAMSVSGEVSDFLADTGVAPGTPSNGCVVYSASGLLTYKGSDGTVRTLTDPVSVLPSDHGLLAWSGDPSVSTSSATTTVAGTQYLSAVYVRKTVSVSKVWWINNAAGGTPTSGQNFAGLYNSAGTLLSSGSADGVVASNGPVSVTLGASQTLTPGFYWVVVMFNAGTQPQIGRTSASVFSNNIANQSAATSRFAINGTGRTTSLLSSITPASNASGAAFWSAVS